MANVVTEYGTPVNLVATGDVVLARNCVLIGFYMNTIAGTLVLRKGGATGTIISGVITPVAGFHRFPAACPGGLHATFGGAGDITFFVVDGQA